MLKILDTNQDLQAIITDYWNDSIDEEINKNFVFTFSAVVDEKSEYLVNDNLVEVEDNLFRIKYYETQMSAQGNIINVFCEHVAYDLIDDNMEWFTATGTPTAILTELFAGSPFTVGTVDFADVTLFSIQEPTNKRAILMQFANALGGELKFDKFEISLLTARGVDEGVQFREAKNIRGITVRKDKRSGTEQTAYSVDLLELRDLPEYGQLEAVGLGDTIRVISPSTSTDVEQRIVKYSYSPKQRINSSVEIANFVEGIEDTITNIKQQTVYKDRVYNGNQIGPEYGFRSTRSDNTSRAEMNSARLGIDLGDGTGNVWTPVFFVALVEGVPKLFLAGDAVFEGDLSAAGGTFTGELVAATGVFDGLYTGTLETDQLIAGSALIGGILIANGAITTDKMTVSQLSAITANLGTVTAGSITSNTTISIGTDATIGNKLFLNANNFGNGVRWGMSAGLEIYIDPISQAMFIEAPGGVYANGTLL